MTDLLLSERLSLREVADRVDVHLTTVWRWALSGVRGRTLPTVFIGGRRFVLKEDLDTFLRQRNSGSVGAASPDQLSRQRNAGAMLDGVGIKRR